jgi:hypothetical protein
MSLLESALVLLAWGDASGRSGCPVVSEPRPFRAHRGRCIRIAVLCCAAVFRLRFRHHARVPLLLPPVTDGSRLACGRAPSRPPHLRTAPGARRDFEREGEPASAAMVAAAAALPPPPPAPRRDFQRHWDTRCEGLWRTALALFLSGEAEQGRKRGRLRLGTGRGGNAVGSDVRRQSRAGRDGHLKAHNGLQPQPRNRLPSLNSESLSPTPAAFARHPGDIMPSRTRAPH